MQEKANCRICGAEFNPCKGIAGIPPEQQPFNWRKICCSPPCGSQFINCILESRGLTGYGVPSEPADAEPAAPEEPEPAAKPRRQPARRTRQVSVQAEPAEAAEPEPVEADELTDNAVSAEEGAE